MLTSYGLSLFKCAFIEYIQKGVKAIASKPNINGAIKPGFENQKEIRMGIKSNVSKKDEKSKKF